MEKYSHNYGEYQLEKDKPIVYSDLKKKIRELSKEDDESIKDAVKSQFEGWKTNKTVNERLSLRYDYRKEKIQIEYQFGNVARYYADIMKLEYSIKNSNMQYGVLIAPTKNRAERMGSNLAYYERAKKEMQEFREIIESPIVLFGL